MRKNFIQPGKKAENEWTYIETDWFDYGIPSNVVLSANVYIDSSYCFAGFQSQKKIGLLIGESSGCYDRASFIVAPLGEVIVGKFCILNGCTIACNQKITIGNHCMMAWGSVITDSWIDEDFSLEARKDLMTNISEDPLRPYPMSGHACPVTLEDNCWVGFGAIILPGVTLGRGCIIGSKTIVSENVPPYAVVVGDPPRIVKYLNPDDSEAYKLQAMNDCIKGLHK